MDSPSVPPAAAAVAGFRQLNALHGRSIAAQAARIAERTALFVPRSDVVAALDDLLGAPGGLVALEAPRGSGATTLLCHLAATRPYAFWLPEDDDGAGLAALCAQLIALYDLPVPLVPPAATRDSTALERILADVGASRPAGSPAVLLLGRPRATDAAPLPDPFPAELPPGVLVVAACESADELPGRIRPTARLALPLEGPALAEALARYARVLGLPEALAHPLAARSGGSFLYVRLAAGLIAAGVRRRGLPAGLGALHRLWWSTLAQPERRLFALLAAAGEPIDPATVAAAAGLDAAAAHAHLERWQALVERHGRRVRLYHPATARFIAGQAGGLAEAHAALVNFAHAASGGRFEQPGWDPDGYFGRQLARHAALAERARGRDTLEALATRAWVLAQERRTGAHRAAAADLAWVLRSAAQSGPPLAVVRSAALAGTLNLLARALPPDAAAEAMTAALERGQPREPTLRRLRAALDQLPDGREKAQSLRRLGEVCFALGMRAAAMRMLSEALDLEAPGLPRAWRDEREETLVAFARAAIARDAPDMALGITTRIVHPERRGMIETEVVRWLLARGQRTRAEEVAYAIGHAGNHEWAMAEVAVGHARAGDFARAGVVLSTLRTDTAVAWVSTEIACDAARRGNPRAADRVALLPSPALRDRALAQVALALVEGGLAEHALDVVRLVMDAETRARAMADLALAHPPLAPEALDEASLAAVSITGEEQASVVVALAAAQAAVGRPADALRTAELLPEGEGRDRAYSRIAVALARTQAFADAEAFAARIQDEDERDWALDELARLLGDAGEWQAAFALAERIVADEQRARTEADLAIGWARAGEPIAAQERARRIEHAGEQLRALSMIVEPLLAAGAHRQIDEALAALPSADARSRYRAALAAALASQGEVGRALEIAVQIGPPLERARVLVAAARAAAGAGDHTRAQAALGLALRGAAALGRRETFLCLSWAADALAAIGGPELLLASAGALDEIDSWWG